MVRRIPRRGDCSLPQEYLLCGIPSNFNSCRMMQLEVQTTCRLKSLALLAYMKLFYYKPRAAVVVFKFLRSTLSSIMLVVVIAKTPSAHAVNQYFNDSGGPLNWDTTTANWGAATGGPYNSLYANAKTTTPFFEGTSGTVNVSSTILSGNITFGVGGYTLDGGNINMTGGNRTLVGASSGMTTINSVLQSTSGQLTFSPGVGGLTLGGLNNFTSLTLNSGAGGLNVSTIGTMAGSAGNLGSGSGATITLATGAILNYTGTGESTDFIIRGASSVGTETINQNGTGILIFSTTTPIFSTSTASSKQTLTLGGSTAGIGQVAAVIADAPSAGTGAVSKTGTGTWILSGANTYSGSTTLSAGTLTLKNQLALQNSQLNINGNSGTLVFDSSVSGNAFTVGSLIGNSASSPILLQNNAGTGAPIALTLSGNNASPATWSGLITGPGSLIKSGTGTQIVATVSPTFSGGTTLNSGTLQLAGSSAGSAGSPTAGPVGIGTFTVNGGTISASASSTRTLYNPLVFGGNVTFGDSSYTGNLTFSAPVDLGGLTRTFTTTSGYGNVTFSGIISDGGLTLAGSGTVILSGANTYFGTTTVEGGSLTLGANNALPSETTVNLAGGNLATGSYDNTVNALQSSGSVLAKGTWGASGSGASHISSSITGTGILTVTTGGSTAIVVTSEGTSNYGNSVTFAATVTGSNGDGSTPAGTVTFYDGGVSIGTSSLIGSGLVATSTLTTSSLSAATHSITAAFGGNASYDLSTSTIYSQVVNPATPIIGGLSNRGINYGTASVVLTGTVSAGSGHPADGETVNVTINGTTEPAMIAGGAGGFSVSFPTATIPPSPTAYTITYAYSGDANLNAAANDTSTTLSVTGINAPDLIFTNAPGVPRVITTSDLVVAGLASSQISPNYTVTVGPAASGGATFTNSTGTMMAYTNSPSFAPASDNFSYTVSDGVNAATATVYLIFTSVTGPQLTPTVDGNSHPVIKFHGLPGYSYHIQRASTLNPPDWTNIQALTLDPNSDGSYSWTDTSVDAMTTTAYYRLSYP